ncbi:hypothetical protein [Nocardia sp. IFM 10818]
MKPDTVLATAAGLTAGTLLGATAHRTRAHYRDWERARTRFTPRLLTADNAGRPLAALSAHDLVAEACAATFAYRRAVQRAPHGSLSARRRRDQMNALVAEYQLRTRRYVLRKMLTPRHRREWRTLVRGWFRLHRANTTTLTRR